jgi:uncharacterized protein (TIGR03790 family)
MWLCASARILRAALVAAAVVLSLPARLPGAGPEQVLLVINDNAALSRRIGSVYAQKRLIPEKQICRLRAPDQETVSRSQFSHLIEAPLLACLRDRGLAGKIHFLAITQGVPLRVESAKGEKLMVDGASVDSELTLLPRRLRGESIPPAGSVANPFFRQRDAPFDPQVFGIYLVTRLAAYTFEDVARMIDQSLAARLAGKVVIDMRGSSDEEGNNWLRTAAVLLPQNRVIFDESTTVVTQVKDAIGYASWGSNDPERRNRFLQFRWLPGAIMSEFVSTNARTFSVPPANWTLGSWRMPWTWFHGSPQSMTADYLREGATGASGHTDEPYLNMCPRPEILFPAYLSGRTLAESYWMSIPGLSWMNVVIGDPLCRLR